jgi:hypothetical protein
MKISDEDLRIAPELRGLNAGNVSNVLNNFMLHFPKVAMVGPRHTWDKTEPMKVKASQAYYRFIAHETGTWDKLDSWEGETGDWVHSAKRMGQTTHQFTDELYKTVRELGLTVQEVSRATTLMYVSQSIGFANLEEWAPTLIRVWVAMRAKGYNRKDLAG